MTPQMNKLHEWSIKLTILATFWILSACNAPTFAQTLIADPGTSNPTNTQTGVNRQQGRKGLLYQMRFFNPAETDSAFPLNMTAATVNLTVGAGPMLACTPGITPAPNACTFVVAAGDDDAALDNVKIFFNGDFPASTSVSMQVTGARTTMPVVAQTADVSNPFVVSFTTGNAPLRNPASLELVFDISGSMAWPTVPGGTVSRMNTLKTGSQSFFAMLNDFAMLGDKVGVTYFSNTATVFDAAPAGATNLEPAHDPTQVGLVWANIQTQNPTNGTSIGDGLLQGNGGTALGGDSATVKRVFLFSDGEQNVAPNVRMTGATLEIVNAANTVVMTYPAGTSVCPVTAGRQTAVGFALQQAIAATCGNNNAVVGDLAETFAPGDLNTYFTQTLAAVLVGDKIEHVRNVNGSIPVSTDVAEKFSANTNDIALSILLSWDTRRQGPRVLPFRLKAPDGTEVDVTDNTQRGFGMSFTTIHFPLRRNNAVVAHKGEWTIELLGSRIDPATGAGPLNYQLIVMLDNANIASEYRVTAQDIGTGEPIPIQVNLRENGTSLTGATVVAQLLGPAEGLGNILSTADTPAGNPNIGGDTLDSEAQRKLLLLLADPASASLFAGRNLPSLVLLDNGQAANGDTTANDGIYSGIFAGTIKEGHYKFAVNVQGTTATNGLFQRAQLLTVFVQPEPDPDRTELTLVSSAKQPDGSMLVRLRATPHDRIGNFLGPDLRGNINIRATGATLQEALSDRLNGSYEIVYRVPSTSSNPNITVEVFGKDVVTRRLNDLGGPFGPGSFKRWAFSLHLGSTFPHGLFGTVLDPGPSFGADLEYRFNSLFSLEAYLGHDRFKDKFFGDSFYITHISGQPKFTFGTGTVRPSVHFGLGAYFPEGGGSNFGGNIGGSIQFWLTPNFAVEPSYNYRIINTGGGSNVKYSTVQGGIRWRF
jgi:hypothetical protein